MGLQSRVLASRPRCPSSTQPPDSQQHRRPGHRAAGRACGPASGTGRVDTRPASGANAAGSHALQARAAQLVAPAYRARLARNIESIVARAEPPYTLTAAAPVRRRALLEARAEVLGAGGAPARGRRPAPATRRAGRRPPDRHRGAALQPRGRRAHRGRGAPRVGRARAARAGGRALLSKHRSSSLRYARLVLAVAGSWGCAVTAVDGSRTTSHLRIKPLQRDASRAATRLPTRGHPARRPAPSHPVARAGR